MTGERISALSDGTLEWDRTTLIVVEARAGETHGLGYSYGDAGAVRVVADQLAPAVVGLDPMDIPAAGAAMARPVRNIGRAGVAAMAVSAVDVALWDLKARLLGVPLARLLGAARPRVPIYGSGGFCSYPHDRLVAQLAGWVGAGMRRVKMKVGAAPAEDAARVRAARQAIGEAPELFVDANGAYRSPAEALAHAEAFAAARVTWLEEPLSSDDLEGLRVVRERAPAGMRVAAGEYGWDGTYFRRMLAAGAVDVLQADATRCLGISGFLQAAALCAAWNLQLSSHCAPSLHLPVCLAAPPVVHMEWFHDHARIERLLFDGAPQPVDGALAADLTRPGLGLELKRPDAARFAV
jgi:L-alanine-DL-glutamate epimerase-like enolase superfamily enzyme